MEDNFKIKVDRQRRIKILNWSNLLDLAACVLLSVCVIIIPSKGVYTLRGFLFS